MAAEKKPTKKKSKNLLPENLKDVIACKKCGAPSTKGSKKCSSCGHDNFEQEWVLIKHPITRNTSVQITKTSPSHGDVKARLTLSKWWPGGRQTFNINDISQLDGIEFGIEKLLPYLNWKKTEKIIEELSSQSKNGTTKKADYDVINVSNPDLLRKLVEAIDTKKLGENDFETLSDVIREMGQAFSLANTGFKDAFLSVVKKLPRQTEKALEDLSLLLGNWNLQAITNVANQVKGRLETIDLFEERINDPKTLEITGDNSIHRILERSMWLVDEKHWLLHSNKTLRKQIGDKMSREDKKKWGNKRPDFVCGTSGNTLVILELKRPAHKLTVEDLNQLENYIVIAKKYSDFTSFQAYLVGNEMSEDLKNTMDVRGANKFKVLFYGDIIQKTRLRYQEYLDAIDNE